MMMVPPTIAHRHIAGNPTRILNDALAKHNQAQIAVSASGVDLGDAARGPGSARITVPSLMSW
jgi:hypothetical protein